MTAEQRGSGREVRLAPFPRYSLALVSFVHALVLGVGALVVPFVASSWFAVGLGVLALLALAVSVFSAFGGGKKLWVAWRVFSFAALVFLAITSFVVVSAGVYLITLYRSIGGAVTGGMVAVWAVVALFTLPLACWGIAKTGGIPKHRRRTAGLSAGALLLLGSALVVVAGCSARLDTAEEFDPEELGRTLLRAVGPEEDEKSDRPKVSLYHPKPVTCAEPVAPGKTLIVTRLNRKGRPTSKCLQANSLAGLVSAAAKELSGTSAPALLDVVTATRPVSRWFGLLDAFAVRPGLDGVCAGKRCLLPHQLVARGMFTHFRPIPGLPTAALGVSLEELEQALGAENGEGLQQFATQTYALQGRKLRPWVRLRRLDTRVDARSVSRAVKRAEQYILAAQADTGAFRYTLDPFTGEADEAQVNLPRQAGTTYALCQLGTERRTTKAVKRALSQLAGYRKALPNGAAALSDLSEYGRLGSSALPLVAYLTCRERVGGDHDALIGELLRFVLTMQRPNGSFYPEYDFARQAPQGDHESLYSAGQAVLALVLAEAAAARDPKLPLPPVLELKAAVERAMNYYANDYWPAPLRSLFYLEENWHCIAAEAALKSHRHDAYERFCIDYTTFKSRLILRASENVDREHVGGYSLSNMLPPHNATTAGFGESLAATLAVMKARDLDISNEKALMREVLSFLISQQWTEDVCLLCAPGVQIEGGFSEHSASPIIRIDYVQHAMAAIGHGGRQLGLL